MYIGNWHKIEQTFWRVIRHDFRYLLYVVLSVFSQEGYSTEYAAEYGGVPVLVGVESIASGLPGESIGNSDRIWSNNARHLYSKIQPWNCDESLLWLSNNDELATQVFLSGGGESVKLVRSAPGSEMRWIPGSRNLMLYVQDSTVGIWNVNNNKKTVIYRFETLGALVIGPYEGNISLDGQWVVFTGEPLNIESSRTGLVSVLFNIPGARVHSSIQHPKNVIVDWISASASGRYIVENSRFNDIYNDTTQVYDQNFAAIGKRWIEYGRPSHYDLSVDALGYDVAVGVSKSKPDDGNLIMRRLVDGHVTVLIDEGYARHTSARSLASQKWVLATYEGQLSNWPPFSNELVVYSLTLGEVKRILRYVSKPEHYWSQAQAVISPSGRAVAWAQTALANNKEYVGFAIAKSNLVADSISLDQYCEQRR